MPEDMPPHVRIGLRKRGASNVLRLRWDRSPKTCAAVIGRLPLEGQIYHAKFANNEVYTLVPSCQAPPPDEWLCAFPAPGDLMYYKVPAGTLKPGSLPFIDPVRGVLDLAYFYDRGNSLLHAAHGPAVGSIFATAISIEDTEKMAEACADVWWAGHIDETLYVEIA